MADAPGHRTPAGDADPHPKSGQGIVGLVGRRFELAHVHSGERQRLGIAQPRVSEIVRGKIELMSLDYLVGLCAKAGVSVQVRLAA